MNLDAPPNYSSLTRQKTLTDDDDPMAGGLKRAATGQRTPTNGPSMVKRMSTGERRIALKRDARTARLREIILATLDREINAVADECDENPNASFHLVESRFMARMDLSLIGDNEVDELYDLDLASMRRLWGRMTFRRM